MRRIVAMRLVPAAHGAVTAPVTLARRPPRRAISIDARRLDRLEDILAATDVALTAAGLDAPGDAIALHAEYPGWMSATQGGRAKLLDPPGHGPVSNCNPAPQRIGDGWIGMALFHDRRRIRR